MCSSEELIHDARQVDLEDVIMTNETPMYLVPGQLTTEQREMFYRAVGNPAALENCISSIGAPIQPCADVETVGWGRETSFVDLKVPGCHAVSIRKEWEGGVPLVRRTDMEAQIAKVVAEKDAEIGRLTIALQNARDALVSVTEGRSEQYQARNGRWVSIQSEDGERCDIIHSDITTECEGALAVVSAVLDKGASE